MLETPEASSNFETVAYHAPGAKVVMSKLSVILAEMVFTGSGQMGWSHVLDCVSPSVTGHAAPPLAAVLVTLYARD